MIYLKVSLDTSSISLAESAQNLRAKGFVLEKFIDAFSVAGKVTKINLSRIESLPEVVSVSIEKKSETSGQSKVEHEVFMVDWIETERGWGQKPSGISLHKSPEDLSKFIRQYWTEERELNRELAKNGEAPDIYDRPENEKGIRVLVDDECFKKIENSECGIRLYHRSAYRIDNRPRIFER